MKSRFLVSLCLFVLLCISFLDCKKDEPEPRIYANVTADFNAIDLTKGIHDETLEFQTGNFWDFRVITPTVQTGTTYPLLIDLHGASGGNPNAHKGSDCYIETGIAGKDFFVIIPNGAAFDWQHLRNQEMVLELTRLALLNWPIDADKVAVTGYSNGGNGSWFYGETQTSIFSAAIPMASSYSVFGLDGNVRNITTPMYVIHGEEDELFPVDSTAKWVDAANAAGSSIEFVIAPGLGHYEPCLYKDYFKDAIDWLETVW